MRATWHGTTIAESDETVVVEGSHYFPASSVKAGLLAPSDHQTSCPWKGTASYHSIVVDGETNTNAVWFYPTPKDAAKEITGRLAFWKGVTVAEV